MNYPTDEFGMPKSRMCTCKNKACRTKWKINMEEPLCPKCRMAYCLMCLTGYEEGKLRTMFYRSGLEVTVEETTCPKCRWNIFEYEYA